MTSLQADRRTEAAQALMFRAALFLLALFAVAQVPLGKGELLGAGRIFAVVASQAYPGDLPGRFATDTSKQQAFASAGPAVAAELSGGDDKADGLAGKITTEAEACADAARGGGFAALILQSIPTGFNPRAPPAA